MNWGGGGCWGGWVPACAGMTERGVCDRECGRAGGEEWAIGVRCDWCAGSWLRTPHLTSPLEGGRDELGKGWAWG